MSLIDPATGRDRTICAVRTCHQHHRRLSRFCTQHANNLARSGDPLMPVTQWRRHVEPNYGAFVREGLVRYGAQEAMEWGRRAAAACLAYREAQWSSEARQKRVAVIMQRLRDMGVTPDALLERVALARAYLVGTSRPPIPAAERIFYGRSVVHMVKNVRPGYRFGNRTYRDVGEYVMTELGPFAIKFIGRLQADIDARERLRQGVEFAPVPLPEALKPAIG